MYCNLENYVLQHRKLYTATSQIVVLQHRKNICYNDPKISLQHSKIICCNIKNPLQHGRKQQKRTNSKRNGFEVQAAPAPSPYHLRVHRREEGIGPKARWREKDSDLKEEENDSDLEKD
jgi:hypothetical protein